jgi:hypothetical protein
VKYTRAMVPSMAAASDSALALHSATQ